MSPRKRKLLTPASESDVPSKQQQQQQQASSSSVEPLAFPNGNAKYNRIHYACSECYRRKQKCNRQRPCQHCLTRNIAHKCKDYIPSNSNPDSNTESVSRLSRLERLLEDYLPRILHRVESASLHASSNALHSTTAPRDRLAWPTSQLALPRNNPTQSTSATASTLAANGTTVDQLEPQGRLSPETGLYNGGPTSHITSLLGGLPGSPPRIQAVHLPIRTTRPTSDFDDAMIKHGRPSPPCLLRMSCFMLSSAEITASFFSNITLTTSIGCINPSHTGARESLLTTFSSPSPPSRSKTSTSLPSCAACVQSQPSRFTTFSFLISKHRGHRSPEGTTMLHEEHCS